MLEIIADAGPMALPLWAVLAFSAAMYPLGFMLGAPCSSCCCPPCDTCTHRLKGGDPATQRFGCLAPFTSVTISTHYETVTKLNWFPDNIDNTQVQIGTDGNGNPLYLVISQFRGIFPYSDACGCLVCAYRVDAFAGGGSLVQIGVVGDIFSPQPSSNANKPYIFFGPCSQTSDTLTDDVTQRLQEVYYPYLDVNGMISITVEYDACECGACCLDGECTEDITEFECEDPFGYFGTQQGEWQGVGVDCDPNPCPQLGACCVNGECYQATEEQCGIDAGAWQAGSCDPSPC